MALRFINFLFSKLETIIAVVLYALTAVAFLQLAMRYILGFSYAGIDELCRLAFVWVVSIGSALAFRKKAHVGITYLANKLSGQNMLYLEMAVLSILTLFMAVVIVAGITMTKLGITQVSEYLEWSMALFYACIPFGAALSIIAFVEELYFVSRKIKGVAK